jgi:SAM-dependent methyltransferase
VLLPLGLAPSQWEPLLPALGAAYTTIVLGGTALGPARIIERRAATAGFRRVVGTLVDALALRPGDRLLDVGCGTGALDRWLAQRSAGANPIVAVDINRFLLHEAEPLARKEDLAAVIEFREGNAEALPFPDGRFDATVSVTVLEEVDADRALAEFVRVTKPGGRVGVMVRAVGDLPRWVNLPLRADLKATVEAPGFLLGGGKSAAGCADASLYRRFRAAGLVGVQMFPQLYGFDAGPFRAEPAAAIRAALGPEEAREWDAAVAHAEADGTFVIAYPCHCAVGTKP